MAIQDLQLFFSNPANGDSIIGNGVDVVSGQVIDQNVNQGLFTGPGGAEITPFLFAKMHTAMVGGTSVQVVLQDSADNITFADVQSAAAVLLASATANALLAAFRIPRSTRRYMRVVYRVVGNVTGGIAISNLLLDVDNIDIWMRKAGVTVAEPTGAADMSVAQGILEQ